MTTNLIFSFLAAPESALSKTSRGRGRDVALRMNDNRCLVQPNVPIPDFLRSTLTRGDLLVEVDDFTNHLSDEETTNFYLTYVHVLPSDISRIYESTTSQNNDAWLAERQVRTLDFLHRTYHYFCSMYIGLEKQIIRNW